MLTGIDLQNEINNSSWPKEAVLGVQNITPGLGQLTISYLNNIYTDLSADSAIDLAHLVAMIPDFVNEIQSNSAASFSQSLEQILRSGDQIKIGFISAFIFDIHENKAVAGKISADLNRAMFVFQMANIENLPSKELALALLDVPADIAMLFNLEAEIKRFSYYKSYEIDSKEYLIFRQYLENSDQLLSQGEIIVDGKSVPCNVKNIILDFNSYTANLAQKSSSYGVAQYVTNSPVLKTLNSTTAKVVIRILEAYTWLFSKNYTENEIKQYETNREKIIELLPNYINKLPPEILDLETYRKPIMSDVSVGQPFQPAPLPDQPIIHLPTQQSTPPANPVHLAPPVQAMRTMDEVIRANPKPVPPPLSKAGVVKDPTNIKMDEEQQRLERARLNKMKSIQEKLAELKARNQKQ